MTNGDLQERLTVSIEPKEGSEPAKCIWKLDEQMADAFWVHEILTGLGYTHHSELMEFLARCLRDATRHPAKPFRAVFSTFANYHNVITI